VCIGSALSLTCVKVLTLPSIVDFMDKQMNFYYCPILFMRKCIYKKFLWNSLRLALNSKSELVSAKLAPTIQVRGNLHVDITIVLDVPCMVTW
jgi:hypothetical protein